MLDYAQWTQAGIDDKTIDRDAAANILRDPQIDLMSLLAAAGQVRRHYFGNEVSIHILDNVRNGACPEDCGYCGQSRDSDAPITPYKTKSVDEIVADAKNAKASGAYRFCMALSGRGPSDRDIDHMCQAIEQVKAMGLRTCLSAGLLDEQKAQRLREAGLDRFNHNLNTSERHYPKICTTHTYGDRMTTIKAAREAGLGLCSGVIVGMDETIEDVLDVAFALRAFKAESIPCNFLLPIEGNRVEQPQCDGQPLSPQFVLRVLAMMRFVNPTAEIRIAAGREVHLRSLQPLALWPANSLFMDGYLLTRGSGAAATLRMILDAGFNPRLDEGDWPDDLRRMAESGGIDAPAASDQSLNVDVEGVNELKPQVRGKCSEPFVPLAVRS
jgi:biotin synthase